MFNSIKRLLGFGTLGTEKKKSICFSCKLMGICPCPKKEDGFTGCITFTPEYIDLDGFELKEKSNG
jgi:hypothetical protein